MSKRRDKKSKQAPSPNAAQAAAAGETVDANAEDDETAIGADTADAEAREPDEIEEPSDATEAPDVVVKAEEYSALLTECEQLREKWLRSMAEMENLRKRTRREVSESRRFAQADVLRSFLDIQDNLERALQSAGGADDTGALPAFKEGVELIFQRFRSLLQEKGVEPIPALDTPFDPTVHEAVGQMPRDGIAEGQVIEVAQTGFRFGDMVLRPARVIISA